MNKNILTVCVLIITYNRKEYLLNLLKSLEKQSFPINKILIFDNYSSDGTDEMLRKEGYVSEVSLGKITTTFYSDISFLYFKNTENSGGSGGFHDGLLLASQEKCDYIWTMDDDVLPESNCLETLLKYVADEAKICIPSRTDEKYNDYAITKVDMSNPFKYNIRLRKTRVSNERIEKDYIQIKDMPFEGPLIATSLVKQIGLPNKDLFIIFDDSEYAFRASKVTELRYVKNAVLHKQIIPCKDKGRLMGWKEYYGYRNQYWFDSIYGENIFVNIFRPIFSFLDLSIRAVVKRKWSNMRVIKKAYYDGIHGVLGKTVNPGEKI